MGIFHTEVKQPFRFLPGIVWAILLDALDIIPNIINFVLQLFGIGIVLDLAVDAVQTFLALIIFEDPQFAIANIDFLLPAGFDLFPAYTAKIVAYELKLVG